MNQLISDLLYKMTIVRKTTTVSRPRVYRRRKVRRVATVAGVKRLISKKVETKALANTLADLTVGNRYVYAYAPFQLIAKGTGHQNRIGSSINNVRLSMAFSWSYTGLNPTGDTRVSSGAPLRVIIVRTPRRLNYSTTAWSSTTATAGTSDALPVFLSGVSHPASSLIDPKSDVKLVKQFWLHSTSPHTSLIIGDTVFKQVSVRIPKYDYDEVTGQGRTHNYYVLVCSQTAPSQASNSQNGILQSSFLLQWKDA